MLMSLANAKKTSSESAADATCNSTTTDSISSNNWQREVSLTLNAVLGPGEVSQTVTAVSDPGLGGLARLDIDVMRNPSGHNMVRRRKKVGQSTANKSSVGPSVLATLAEPISPRLPAPPSLPPDEEIVA
jgi:hypothetical protein